MSNIRDGFGKAKEGTGLLFFKVGEDESKQFRIFPPKGKLAAAGKWAVFVAQHYGYSVPATNDPGKTFVRPFLCVEEKNGDQVVVSCPECRKIEDRKRIMDEVYKAEVARGIGEKLTQSQAEAQAEKLVESHRLWLSGEKGTGKGGHNLDRKWNILAMNEEGQIGFLLIPHKCKKLLDIKKKKLLADEGIDLLDIDKGAWVEISRTGNFRTTEYEVQIAQEHTTTNGVRAKITKVSGFSEEQLTQALALPDIDSLVRKITRDQIRMLTEGSGAPEEVEAILNMGQKHTPKEESPTPVRELPKAASMPQPVVQVHTAPVVAQPASDPQAASIAALQAQLASLMAAKQAAPAVAPAATKEDVKALSDSEFLAKFGPSK